MTAVTLLRLVVSLGRLSACTMFKRGFLFAVLEILSRSPWSCVAGWSISGISEAALNANPVVTMRGMIRFFDRIFEESWCPTESTSQHHRRFWCSIETTRSYTRAIISWVRPP